MRTYQQFFAELKRRKVFKVAGVYGVVAFVLLQVADLLGQGLRLPESFMPFITAVVLLGFPLALILAWAFEVTPDGVQVTEGAAPGEIEAIVAEPASKRWPAGLLALVGTAALLAGAWWAGLEMGRADESVVTNLREDSLRLTFPNVADDERPSIAVLPFADMSPAGDQEYFSDGMTEEILGTLANVRELRVSGRTSTFAYKGRDKDLREIGDELGVTYLVEGSVRKAGNQLRITAQLIDAADGAHLWSDTYDRQLEDVFTLQTEIAEAIATALRVPLGLEGDERLVSPATDIDGYDLYLTGRTKMRQRGPALTEAIKLFEAAIARDSTWAPAWAALAETRELRVWYGETYDWAEGQPDSVGIAQFLAEADRAAHRALALDPGSASALVALGSVNRDRGQWAAAEEAYRQALSLDPDNAEAYQQYAEMLYARGRVAEAVRSADRAVMLDPAPIRFSILSQALQFDDRAAEAAEVMRVAMARDPNVTLRRTWFEGAYLLARQGETAEAIEALKKALRSTPWVSAPADRQPWWTEEAFQAWARGLSESRALELPEGFPWSSSAHYWALAGRPDKALEQILDGNHWTRMGLPWDIHLWQPGLDSLRSDPAVRSYMASIGLGDVVLQRTPPQQRTRPLILLRETERPSRSAGARP